MIAFLFIFLTQLTQPAHSYADAGEGDFFNDFLKEMPEPNPTEEVFFGPEFTFSNEAESIDIDSVRKYFYARLVTRETEIGRFAVKGDSNSQYVSPSGWEFYLTRDGAVIEVTMPPMTVGQFKRHKDEIQKYLFDIMAEQGFRPRMFTGGGHINIGLAYFYGKDLLLRNFIVDFWNHSELGMGALNYDTNNALPFALYNNFEKLSLAAEVERLTHGGVYMSHRTSSEILVNLKNITSRMPDEFRAAWFRNEVRGKFVALSFVNTSLLDPEERRIEVRCVRPQVSADVWVRQIELFKARIEYLKTLNSPLPIQSEVKIEETLLPFGKHQLTPPLNPRDALRAFYNYVTESGLEWRDHRDYLWPMWLTSGEVDIFEKSPWFKLKELTKKIRAKRACADLLKTIKF